MPTSRFGSVDFGIFPKMCASSPGASFDAHPRTLDGRRESDFFFVHNRIDASLMVIGYQLSEEGLSVRSASLHFRLLVISYKYRTYAKSQNYAYAYAVGAV